jgi:hypothetical protein
MTLEDHDSGHIFSGRHQEAKPAGLAEFARSGL